MSVKSTIEVIEKVFQHHYEQHNDPVSSDCLQVWAMNHGQRLIDVSKAVKGLLKAIDKAETLARFNKTDPEFDRFEFPFALDEVKNKFKELEDWTEEWEN